MVCAVARHIVHGLVDDAHRVGHEVGQALAGQEPGLLLLRQLVPLPVPFADRGRGVGLGQTVDVDGPEIEVAEPGEQRRRGWRAADDERHAAGRAGGLPDG